MLGIISYGMGNLASVRNALDYLQIDNRIIASPGDLKGCDRAILPGVGAYGEAMEAIKAKGFQDEILEFVHSKQRPLLGICLGMQLLLDSSVEHGLFYGLGITAGKVCYLGDHVQDLPLPHVGWNEVESREDSGLMRGIAPGERSFYFVHNYYCHLADRSVITGRTNYSFSFDVMFEAGNVCGVQFHPEKSQKSGLALLNNFGECLW